MLKKWLNWFWIILLLISMMLLVISIWGRTYIVTTMLVLIGVEKESILGLMNFSNKFLIIAVVLFGVFRIIDDVFFEGKYSRSDK